MPKPVACSRRRSNWTRNTRSATPIWPWRSTSNGSTTARRETLEPALASARRALALDENDSRCHRILSSIYAHLRQYDRAEFHSERSIALNPNDALAAMNRARLLR